MPLGERWSLLANWTHNDAENSTNEQRLRRPKNIGNFGLWYRAAERALQLHGELSAVEGLDRHRRRGTRRLRGARSFAATMPLAADSSSSAASRMRRTRTIRRFSATTPPGARPTSVLACSSRPGVGRGRAAKFREPIDQRAEPLLLPDQLGVGIWSMVLHNSVDGCRVMAARAQLDDARAFPALGRVRAYRRLLVRLRVGRRRRPGLTNGGSVGSRRLHPLAAAIRRGLIGAGASLLVPAVFAQPTQAPRDIDEVVVIEEAGDRYRVEDNSMSKLSESIRDTPQSIATISKELLDDRGVTSLNDALRNTPGITLGAGEFSWQGNNPTHPRLQCPRRHVSRRLARLRQLSARSVQSRDGRNLARPVVDSVRPRLDGRRHQPGDEAAVA